MENIHTELLKTLIRDTLIRELDSGQELAQENQLKPNIQWIGCTVDRLDQQSFAKLPPASNGDVLRPLPVGKDAGIDRR